jgi:hypothetical protein
MAYRYHGRAQVDANHPSAFAICDSCGFLYNHRDLNWQFEYAGMQLQNMRMLKCPKCLDTPQVQLQPVILPADPPPVLNARPMDYTTAETDWRVTQDGDIRSTQDEKLRVVQSSATEAEEG